MRAFYPRDHIFCNFFECLTSEFPIHPCHRPHSSCWKYILTSCVLVKLWQWPNPWIPLLNSQRPPPPIIRWACCLTWALWKSGLPINFGWDWKYLHCTLKILGKWKEARSRREGIYSSIPHTKWLISAIHIQNLDQWVNTWIFHFSPSIMKYNSDGCCLQNRSRLPQDYQESWKVV